MSHLTLFALRAQLKVPIIGKKNAQGPLHISQNCHGRSGRTDLTLVSRRKNLFFSVFFWQWDYQRITGQKTDGNGSEVPIDMKCGIQSKSRHADNQFG